MKKTNKIILSGLVVLFLVFFLNSISLASILNGHHHHLKALSPIVKKGQTLVIFCRFSGHHLTKFCPHHLKEAKEQHCVISSECGGSPFSKNSITVSFDTIFFEIQETVLFEVLTCAESYPFDLTLTSIFLDISDPPPKIFS